MTQASKMHSRHFRPKTIQGFYFLFPYEQDDQRDTRRFMLYLGSELNRSRVIISPCLHVQTRIRLDHRSAPIHCFFSVQSQDVQTQEQLLHLGFKTLEYCHSLADTRASIKNQVHIPLLLCFLSRLGTSKGVPRNLLIRCNGYGMSTKTRRVASGDHKTW